MSEQTRQQKPDPQAANEARRILEEAWAYYTAGPLPEPPPNAFDEVSTAA